MYTFIVIFRTGKHFKILSTVPYSRARRGKLLTQTIYANSDRKVLKTYKELLAKGMLEKQVHTPKFKIMSKTLANVLLSLAPVVQIQECWNSLPVYFAIIINACIL